MESKYLVDTNVIIDYFGGKLPVQTVAFLQSIPFAISVVTKIEVLGWHKATPAQLLPLQRFMDWIPILPFTENIVQQTIALRQAKKIDLGDALIAATALC